MKKRGISLIITSFFVLSNIGVAVQAAGTENANDTTAVKSTAGITPDSVFYKVDKLLDDVKVALSFGDVSKAQSLMKVAEERLAESKVMAEAGKADLAVKALNANIDALSNAESKVKDATKNEKDGDSESKKSKLDRTLEQLVEQYDMSKKESDALETLAKTLISGTSYSSVENMQIAKKVAVAKMVDARHAVNDARQAYHKYPTDANKKLLDEASATLESAVKDKQTAVHLNLVKQDENKTPVDSKDKEKDKAKAKDKKTSDSDEKSQVTSGTDKPATPAPNTDKSNNGKGNSKK